MIAESAVSDHKNATPSTPSTETTPSTATTATTVPDHKA
jgi:hypothetical protein